MDHQAYAVVTTTTTPDTNGRVKYSGTNQHPVDMGTNNPIDETPINFNMEWKGMLQATATRLSRDSPSGDLYHKMCEFCGDPGGLNGVVVPPPDWLTEEVDRKQWLKRDQNALLYFYYKTSKYKKHMQKIIDQEPCDLCCDAKLYRVLWAWQKEHKDKTNSFTSMSERFKYWESHNTHERPDNDRKPHENDGCTYYMAEVFKPAGKRDYETTEDTKQSLCCQICCQSCFNCCGFGSLTILGLPIVMSYLFNDKSIKDATQFEDWCCQSFCTDTTPKVYFSFYERLRLSGLNVQKRYENFDIPSQYSTPEARAAAALNLPKENPLEGSCCYFCWCGSCEMVRMQQLTSYYIRKRYGGNLIAQEPVINPVSPGYGAHRAQWTALHRISAEHEEWMKMISQHDSGHPYSYKLKWNAKHTLPWTGELRKENYVLLQPERAHHLVWGRERVGAKYLKDPPVNIPGKEPEQWTPDEWRVAGYNTTRWDEFAQLPVGLFEDWIDVNKTVEQHNAMWHNLRSITLHLNTKDLDMQ